MSRVDVVVPCYKYAHFLRGCVQSVLMQKGVDVRVLIIDDCSPDDTPQVAAQLLAEDPRVEYRRHQANQGHIATYNEGLLEWADGDYCLLLSADDMLTPGALNRAARVMGTRSEVVMTYGRGFWTADPELELPQTLDTYDWNVIDGEEFIERSCVEGGNLVTTPTAVVRTSVQRKLGGYRKELPHTGDMEMWLRLAAHGSIGFVDTYQAFYRTHGQNMYTAYAGPRDLRQRAIAFDVLFDEHRSRMCNPDRLRALSRNSLAWAAFWAGMAFFDRGELEASRECHGLAMEFYPAIRRSASWWKFRCKQVIGPRLSGRLRRVAARIRHRRHAFPELPATTDTQPSANIIPPVPFPGGAQ
jgi:glycosyltransferase involved in cell wall biosynthesis